MSQVSHNVIEFTEIFYVVCMFLYISLPYKVWPVSFRPGEHYTMFRRSGNQLWVPSPVCVED